MADDDFDLASLAVFLNMHPQQVSKLADRGKLPGRRLGGTWHFPRPEIHLWLEQRIGTSGEEELVEVESVLAPDDSEEDPRTLTSLFSHDTIAIPLSARTRGSVISSMADLAASTGMLWDAKKMADAVRAREEMHTTALEIGVALLHPRRPQQSILGDPVIALGITGQGIPFGGRNLTDIFFLLCSLDDKSHLRTLARLSRVLTTAEFPDRLRQCGNSADALDLISVTEAELP